MLKWEYDPEPKVLNAIGKSGTRFAIDCDAYGGKYLIIIPNVLEGEYETFRNAIEMCELEEGSRNKWEE
ncbi:MAG: hypothetical protein GY737_00030 [Desulfobacteraceae bacterium]|nr:hypothetical protein [Desulfobacteraceae bacterium]